MRSVAALLDETKRALQDAGSEEPRIEAELLLMHAAGLTRAHLYARWGDPIGREEEALLQALTARRARREPLAYILGRREFFGRDFMVDHRVLIPRPETELLVETALEWLGRVLPPLAGGGTAPLSAADIGTGSGAIAITLAAERADVQVYAIDRSPDAIEVARANAEHHQVNVTFLQGDLLESLPGPVNLILANLPYVPSGLLPQWCGAAQTELAWEPLAALDGGDEGLDVIRRFLQHAPAYLAPGGALLMEIGWNQATQARALAQTAFPKAAVAVRKDLAGLDRLVVVQTR